ncbi:MAG TPA: lysophospholipid acyltransferase family protein [Methylomirabilota bacterium]|nr:lysophospholipid acyltransferase family protein [Methylomirabilota bacterium]
MLYAIVRPIVYGLLRLLFRYRAVGVAHVPAAGAVLLASNHASLLDPPIVGAAVPRPLHFMAKAELFRVPLLGALIRRLNAHPVIREGGDTAALRLALRLLREGHALLVFPEGTRTRDGQLGAGKAGVGMLAAQAGVPVVPVYVSGSARALPRGTRWPRPGRVTVAYGPPLSFNRERGKTRYQAISDEIMAAIGRLQNENEERARAVPAGLRHDTDPTAARTAFAGRIH